MKRWMIVVPGSLLIAGQATAADMAAKRATGESLVQTRPDQTKTPSRQACL